MWDIFLAGDRKKLYDYGQPLFNELKDKYGITHFYFHLSNGRNFLRLHNKDIYGDEINRITFKNAKTTGKIASGIELGKTAFALRVVAPYYKDSKLIGYVELGKEIDHFIDFLKSGTKNEFALIADKKYLDRKEWRSVRGVAGLSDNWDESEEHLWVSRHLNHPAAKACFAEGNIEEFEKKASFIRGFQGMRDGFACGGFPIYDAAGKDVGVVLALLDVSDQMDLFKKTATSAGLAFLFLSILTFLFIGLLIKKTVSSPIERISRIAGAIAGGDLGRRITVNSKDEIGELANTMNEMASSLDEAKKELDRRLLELYTLYNVSKVLNTTFETEQLLLKLVTDISKNLDISRVMIMLLEERTQELYSASFTGFETEGLKEVRRKIGEGLYGLVAQTGTGRLTKDVDSELGLDKVDILSPDIRSIIAVPFGRRDKVLGLMCAFKDRPGMFEWRDLELFRAVAEHVAVALENARLYQETKLQAITDGLTGLYNHRFFREQLAIELEKAGRYGRNMSLIILDIDHFKHYNDTHGHPQGDELLRTLAELLRKSIRKSDLACRYGGEEFALILPETGKKTAYSLAERIRKAISEHPFPFREIQPMGALTVSIGVSMFPVDHKEIDGLIKKADDALYRAKDEGRNRVVGT